jgi:hypothetical protein
MRSVATPIPHRLAAMAIASFYFVGCGDGEELPNRVAIEVAVQIGGKAVSDGDLILRPKPGVKCPLIKIPVVGGVGRLSQAAGPVPGDYQATFRPGRVHADLTKQLSQSGRLAPRAAGSPDASNSSASELTPQGDMPLTVPDKNPAFVAISFDPA